MKPGAHVLSIDDGPFEKRRDRDVPGHGQGTASRAELGDGEQREGDHGKRDCQRERKVPP